MSLAGLFDHRAEIWRPSEKRGYGAQVEQTMVPVLLPTTGLNCAVVPGVGQQGGLATQNVGPGETVRGRIDVYLAKGLDVQERDVLRLITGPESPSTWRVDAVARPRGHHIEASVTPWVGTLEAD